MVGKYRPVYAYPKPNPFRHAIPADTWRHFTDTRESMAKAIAAARARREAEKEDY